MREMSKKNNLHSAEVVNQASPRFTEDDESFQFLIHTSSSSLVPHSTGSSPVESAKDRQFSDRISL